MADHSPSRRSRRLAGKTSGVEWSKEMNTPPKVVQPPASIATGTIPTAAATAAATQAQPEPIPDEQEAPYSLPPFVHTVLLPLFLIPACPLAMMVLCLITNDPAVKSMSGFSQLCADAGVAGCLGQAANLGAAELWPAVQFLLGFGGLAGLLFAAMPGRAFNGPVSPKGHVPAYVDNAMPHMVLFVASFVLGGTMGGLYDMGLMFDLFPAINIVLNAFGILFCALLLLKGLYAPSGPDSGSSGKGVLFDYYWGAELYPRIMGVDVKADWWHVQHFVNCRFSMTFWMVSGISFACKSHEMHGRWDPGLVLAAASTAAYLVKFFWWEAGYLATMDITDDRAGFYETYGCLAIVPTLYTVYMRAAVLSPSELSWSSAGLLFCLSVIGLLGNFLADEQKMSFRQSNGTELVWGKPAKYIQAKYRAVQPNGTTKIQTSKLLASGYWGVARHFHYFFELLAAWSWAMLAGGPGHNLVAFGYPLFLTVLLVHRCYRDEIKCSTKYGEGFRQYCEVVPYRILPYVF